MSYPIATRGGRGSGTSSPYVPALGDLVLSGALVAGVPSSGTILNATTGSAIVSTVSGLTVNSTARTYSYNGSGLAGSMNNGLTETLAGATFSPRGNVVAIVSAAVPAFTSNPSISPQGGNVGGTFSGIDGAMSNGGSILSRRWLLNGTPIGSGTTVVPASAESLIFESTGTGNVVASSSAVTIAAVAGTPSIAFAASTASVTEGDSGTKTVANLINVTRNGVTGPLTVNLSYSGTTTSGTDYVAGPVSATIADGQSSLSFDLTINGDTGFESDETVVINAVLDGYPDRQVRAPRAGDLSRLVAQAWIQEHEADPGTDVRERRQGGRGVPEADRCPPCRADRRRGPDAARQLQGWPDRAGCGVGSQAEAEDRHRGPSP